MPRYIDADEFMQRALGTKCFHNDYALMLTQLVSESTTLSPDEVRGVGKWIAKETNGKVWWYECSCCGTRPLKSRWANEETLSCYCPNCGARMEVSDDE